jgi:hypothetical protein
MTENLMSFLSIFIYLFISCLSNFFVPIFLFLSYLRIMTFGVYTKRYKGPPVSIQYNTPTLREAQIELFVCH